MKKKAKKAKMHPSSRNEHFTILGLTGRIRNIRIAVPALEKVGRLADKKPPQDIDLKRMSEWAMNYLTQTPRKEFNFEPVFQCNPRKCPPIPSGRDVVVPCDTDARMEWEFPYMREICGSRKFLDMEAAFHRRMRNYMDEQGGIWTHVGCYNEGEIDAVYKKKDFIFHTWGATKALKYLSEEYLRNGRAEVKEQARKVMLALKKFAKWDAEGRCWFEGGMGAIKRNGKPVANGWNKNPAPIVEPLVAYWLATHDEEGLHFAKAYAEGMIQNVQPYGIYFEPDGSVTHRPHSHALMHAVWGVAHLGLAIHENRYVEFARKVWNWMLSRGTGTGWFPAGPDYYFCTETCCISDMMSIAALIARGGHPEYFDYAERYMRNYISNLQFIVTPEFEKMYRQLNKDVGEEKIREGLQILKKFQGGIIGGSGLNDYENELLGGETGFMMYGCCAPEGMRAIYTVWSNTIDRLSDSPLGPAGVYVNMSFNRSSKWGEVVSFMPDAGRLTVRASLNDLYLLRPPHWIGAGQVRAFVNGRPIPVEWSGAYVRFRAEPGDELTITYPLLEFVHQAEKLWLGRANRPDLKMTFHWRGNMVTDVQPAPEKTPLFHSRPRVLPRP